MIRRFFVFAGLVIFSHNCFAISLDEYLSEVREQNAGYISSNQSIISSELISKKAFLLTSPNLFVDLREGFQEQNQAVAFVRYKEVKTKNYSAGIEQSFPFGVDTRLYYNFNRTEYQGLTSSAFSPVNYETNPMLDLTIPLWQGALGGKIKANKDLIYYQNQADKFNSQAVSIELLVEAEKLYWQVVAAKEIVDISKETLQQSEKILQTSKKKSQMNLGEKADVLQAMADVESKKLKLKQAENNARIAVRNFNQKRGLASDELDQKLDKIDFNALEKLPLESSMQNNRADVKAAAALTQSAVAAAKIEEESNKPKLDVSGHYAFNGLERNRSQAISNSLEQNGDEAYVGVRFSMPLAIGLQSDIRKGARVSASAARKNYVQKVLDQNNDWQNLLQNLQDYKENLELSRRIEKLQKSKLENERSLLKQGRTSTYQILLFEQDYNQARLNTINDAYQLLSLIADKKLYQ
ncbi:MAG: putative outer membrane protein [Rickettsiaceae bacterium]|jgi:outer membrane protein TolC|nr:putative outer membrane protein [Rickettsiaceae bacterium]